MHGWGHGDRDDERARSRRSRRTPSASTSCSRDVRALGFDTIDLWGAHLSPDWATDEHVDGARDGARAARPRASRRTRPGSTRRTSSAPASSRSRSARRSIGARLLGRRRRRSRRCSREHGVRLAIENHPERTPAERAREDRARRAARSARPSTPAGGRRRATTPARAIEELGEHVLHVHLKDVLAAASRTRRAAGARASSTSRRACARSSGSATRARSRSSTSRRTHDPSEDVPRDARASCEEWLA